MKRTLLILLLSLVMTCSVGVNAFANSDPCHGWATGVPSPFPPGYYGCQYQMYSEGSWTCVINKCPPAAAAQETKSKCPFCGLPIAFATGNTYIVQTDVRVPGLSNGLILERTWNSMWPTTQMSSQVGLFGPNWRSTYEERIFVGSDNFVKYARSDGSFWSFGGGGTLYLVAPANVAATLTVDSGFTQWTLTFQNGEKRIFSYTSGSLTAIIDRNGNTTQVAHDALNRLASVTDPAGRHLYFSYANDSSYLVISITSDIGLSLSYAYDSQGRLTQVTKPDQTTLSFEYDSNSLITIVKDSNGKVLESHTYDSQGRGLTSSRANGVEGVTITYPHQ